MIPKIIHYCWFSFSTPPIYPEDVRKCIHSWKEKLPDYEIMLWNADNFDVNICTYVKEAYQEKKYAFVSDYVRLWALYNYGGIYLDSDIEVLKSFDELLNNTAFTGFETESSVATCIFASEKGNPLFKQFMNDYQGRHFIISEGQYDMTPNPVPITKRLLEHGLKLNGTTQKLDLITVYEETCFCPFNPNRKSGDCFTEKTYCNHHFNGSWKNAVSVNEKKYLNKKAKYEKILGKHLGWRMCSIVSLMKEKGLIEGLKLASKLFKDDVMRLCIHK
ncbi:MAG: glycosyl transferase [Roseburia sp.]|nr:glycosyl transferase [Roseburia sp.]